MIFTQNSHLQFSYLWNENLFSRESVEVGITREHFSHTHSLQNTSQGIRCFKRQLGDIDLNFSKRQKQYGQIRLVTLRHAVKCNSMKPFCNSISPLCNVLLTDSHLQLSDGLVWESQDQGESGVVVKSKDFSGKSFVIKNFDVIIFMHHLHWNGCIIINMKIILKCIFWVKWQVPFTLKEKERCY